MEREAGRVAVPGSIEGGEVGGAGEGADSAADPVAEGEELVGYVGGDETVSAGDEDEGVGREDGVLKGWS